MQVVFGFFFVFIQTVKYGGAVAVHILGYVCDLHFVLPAVVYKYHAGKKSVRFPAFGGVFIEAHSGGFVDGVLDGAYRVLISHHIGFKPYLHAAFVGNVFFNSGVFGICPIAEQVDGLA
jgi:hypothetical protein